MRKIVLSLISLCLFVSSCSSGGNKYVEPETGEKLVFTTELSYPNLLFSEAITQKVITEIKSSADAQNAYDKWVIQPAGKALQMVPNGFTTITADNQKEVKAYADAILSLAIKWHLDQDVYNRESYIKKANDLLIKLAQTNTATDHTPRETLLLSAYEGYSIIKNALPESQQAIIDNWIEKRYQFYNNLELTGNLKANNWETIRINFLAYYAVILNKESYFLNALTVSKEHLVNNVLVDGKTIDFVHRDAFAYHAYDLAFWGRILRSVYNFKGIEAASALMTHNTSEHGSLQDAMDFWKPYLLNPDENIHLEFVNTQWEPDKARSDYNKAFNPLSVFYALDEIAFVNRDCRSVVEELKGENVPYGHSLNYWISLFY